MNEENIIEDFEDYSDFVEESDPDSLSESGSDSMSNEELIEELRDLLSTEEESTEEESTEEESTEEESTELIDYSDILDSIYSEITLLNDNFSSYVEEQNLTLFDKPLMAYTVPESLMCIMVSCVIIKFFLKLIDNFTPKIWH